MWKDDEIVLCCNEALMVSGEVKKDLFPKATFYVTNKIDMIPNYNLELKKT